MSKVEEEKGKIDLSRENKDYRKKKGKERLDVVQL